MPFSTPLSKSPSVFLYFPRSSALCFFSKPFFRFPLVFYPCSSLSWFSTAAERWRRIVSLNEQHNTTSCNIADRETNCIWRRCWLLLTRGPHGDNVSSVTPPDINRQPLTELNTPSDGVLETRVMSREALKHVFDIVSVSALSRQGVWLCLEPSDSSLVIPHVSLFEFIISDSPCLANAHK